MMRKISLSLLLAVSTCALVGCVTPGTAGKAGKTNNSKFENAISNAAVDAAKSGYNRESLALNEKLYNNAPDNPDFIIAYARSLRHAGRIQDAILVVRTPAKDKNATEPLMTECAMALIADGNYQEAEDFAKKAVQKNKKSPDAEQAYALALSGLGIHDRAEMEFQRAIDIWPKGRDKTAVINNLAMSQAAQGRIKDARATMSLATGEALQSEVYQNNRSFLAALADTPTKDEIPEMAIQAQPVEKVTKDELPGIPTISGDVPAADQATRAKPVLDEGPAYVVKPILGKSKKMQPILETN